MTPANHGGEHPEKFNARWPRRLAAPAQVLWHISFGRGPGANGRQVGDHVPGGL